MLYMLKQYVKSMLKISVKKIPRKICPPWCLKPLLAFQYQLEESGIYQFILKNYIFLINAQFLEPIWCQLC